MANVYRKALEKQGDNAFGSANLSIGLSMTKCAVVEGGANF